MLIYLVTSSYTSIFEEEQLSRSLFKTMNTYSKFKDQGGGGRDLLVHLEEAGAFYVQADMNGYHYTVHYFCAQVYRLSKSYVEGGCSLD